MHTDRATEGWAKYGLVGPAIAAEHLAWRTHFENNPEVRAEFEQHLESFKSHWRK